MKYLYLTLSSTSQITILLNESLIEELTGWLTVNNGEIVRIEKPRKKKSTPGKFALQGICYNEIINRYCSTIRIVYANNCSDCNVKPDPSGYCRILREREG